MKKMRILRKLNIKKRNFGASYSYDWWAKTKSHGEIDSINPANEKNIARVYPCAITDYHHIVEQAKKAFLTWRKIPAPRRGEIVRQIGQLLREKKSLLGSLVSLETGKSKQEGEGEVQEMIDMADFAVGQARMLYGKTMPSERVEHRFYEQWHPLGIVGVITAFNFPVAVWAWNAFIAAICGDVVIWKPSSKTPLCAIAIQQICNQVMKTNALEGIFSLVIAKEHELAQTMVNDHNIALVAFTGSTKVGNRIQQMVAKRMGRYLLECGGNNAVILDSTADLQVAIPAIVFGAIGTAGQRCTTTRRLIVQESIYDKTISQLKEAYQKITIGDPLDEKHLMGPVIDQAAVDLYVSAIKRIKTLGGEIIYGGEVLTRSGFYVQPTLASANNDWDIVQTETFVPILYVMKYRDIDEAITMHNNVCQGLSSSIFTTDLRIAERFLSVSGSDCGIVNVNIGTSGAEIGGAFGGEKATGGGREAGSNAWQAYMRRQTNTINWGDSLPLSQGIKFKIDQTDH